MRAKMVWQKHLVPNNLADSNHTGRLLFGTLYSGGYGGTPRRGTKTQDGREGQQKPGRLKDGDE